MKGVSRSSWLAGWLQREEMRRSKSKGKSDTLFTQLIIAVNREQLQTTGALEGRWPAIPRVKHSTINRWTCDLLFKLTSKLLLHSIAKPYFDGECVKHSIFSQFTHTNDTVPPDKDNKTSKGKKTNRSEGYIIETIQHYDLLIRVGSDIMKREGGPNMHCMYKGMLTFTCCWYWYN